MKENKKNKNASKKLVTLASVGLSSAVAFAVAAPLIINAQNSSSKNVSQQPKLALSPIAPNSQVEKGIEGQNNNVAPKYLYSLPIMDSNVMNNAKTEDDMLKFLKYVSAVQTGVGLWGLTDDANIANAYSDAASAVALNYVNVMQNIGLSSTNDSKFTDAKNLFLANEVNKNYKLVNKIGDTVDNKSALTITKPKEVRSVATSLPDGSSHILNVTDPAGTYLMNRDNFEYKIAEINLSNLKAQGSLVFNYKDNAQADVDQHEYKIVISNENKEIDRFLSGNKNLSDLIDNQTIFIRDMKSIANAPEAGQPGHYNNNAKQFINDKFRFVYKEDPKTQTPILSLYVKPDDSNIGDKGIEIGIDSASSNKTSIQSATTRWGFLDNSLAPDHLKALDKFELTSQDVKDFLQNPIDPTKVMVKSSDVSIESSSLSVFSASAKWQQNDENYSYVGGATKVVGSGKNGQKGANWLRIFLGKQMKIAKEIQFAGSSAADNFEEGSAKELSIQYLGGDVTPSAKVEPTTGFVIRKEAEAQAKVDLKNSQRFAVLSTILENPKFPGLFDDSYLATDIVFNRGIASFSADSTTGEENDFEVPNIAQKIFFENPFNLSNPVAPTLLSEPRTSPQVVVTDQGKKFIANVMQNWTYKSTITTPSDQILSFKGFVDLFKQTNKADFDALDAALADLELAQKANDAAAETTAQVAVDAASKKIYNYFPKWPFGDGASLANVKDSDMIFDDSVTPGNTNTLDAFVYKYRRFHINELKNIAEDSGNARTHGLYQVDSYDPVTHTYSKKVNGAPSTFEWTLDPNGNKIAIETTGEEIYKHFNAYTSEMKRWQKEKLAIDDKLGLGSLEPYDPPQPGQIMGWVQMNLISRAGEDGAKLNLVASALSKIWVNSLAIMTSEEKDAIDEITTAGILPNGWLNSVKDAGDENNKIVYPSGFKDTDPHYLISKQYIYIILQAYFVKMLNKILEIETQQLEDNKMLALSDTFKKFFALTDGVDKISDGTIKSVDTKGTDLEKLKLVGVNGYGTEVAQNGFESLRSLITFIYNSGLQEHFLDDAVSIANFNKFMEAGTNGGLDDPQLFVDESKKETFKEVMNSTSKILNKTFNKNQTFTSLSEIMNKMDSGTYDKAIDGITPLDDLKRTIKAAINTISTNVLDYNKLVVFGAETKYTYLQSLAIGKNLFAILTEYIDRKKAENKAAGKSENDSLKQVIDFIHESKEYDEKSVASLAVSLGYYNLEYFVENLTNPNKVVPMARELLSKDLSKDIQLKVDDSNQLVNIISQPGSLAKYAFLGIGASTALIGGSIFGLSFRKSVRTSRKNIIMERAIFIGIAVLGIALALFGIIPGIL